MLTATVLRGASFSCLLLPLLLQLTNCLTTLQVDVLLDDEVVRGDFVQPSVTVSSMVCSQDKNIHPEIGVDDVVEVCEIHIQHDELGLPQYLPTNKLARQHNQKDIFKKVPAWTPPMTPPLGIAPKLYESGDDMTCEHLNAPAAQFVVAESAILYTKSSILSGGIVVSDYVCCKGCDTPRQLLVPEHSYLVAIKYGKQLLTGYQQYKDRIQRLDEARYMYCEGAALGKIPACQCDWESVLQAHDELEVTACPNGQYWGGCTASSLGRCKSCTNINTDVATFTSAGTFDSNDCAFQCKDGFVFDITAVSRDTACTPCSPCPLGYKIIVTCTTTSDTVCELCPAGFTSTLDQVTLLYTMISLVHNEHLLQDC